MFYICLRFQLKMRLETETSFRDSEQEFSALAANELKTPLPALVEYKQDASLSNLLLTCSYDLK